MSNLRASNRGATKGFVSFRDVANDSSSSSTASLKPTKPKEASQQMFGFYTGDDGDLSILSKKLLKKDIKTKQKALHELADVLRRKSDKEVSDFLPFFVHAFGKLSWENNRNIRELLSSCIDSVVVVEKRLLSPHMKKLVGPWWILTGDTVKDVAERAHAAFLNTIPLKKRQQVLIYLFPSIIREIAKSLSYSVETLSDMSVVSVEEAIEKHERLQYACTSSLIRLLSYLDEAQNRQLTRGVEINAEDVAAMTEVTPVTLLGGVSSTAGTASNTLGMVARYSDAINDQLLSKGLRSSYRSVRLISSRLIVSISAHAPQMLQDKSVVTEKFYEALLQLLDELVLVREEEALPVVGEEIRALLDCVVVLLCHCPDFATDISRRERFLMKLYSLLKARSSLLVPYLVPIVGNLPADSVAVLDINGAAPASIGSSADESSGVAVVCKILDFVSAIDEVEVSQHGPTGTVGTIDATTTSATGATGARYSPEERRAKDLECLLASHTCAMELCALLLLRMNNNNKQKTRSSSINISADPSGTSSTGISTLPPPPPPPPAAAAAVPLSALNEALGKIAQNATAENQKHSLEQQLLLQLEEESKPTSSSIASSQVARVIRVAIHLLRSLKRIAHISTHIFKSNIQAGFCTRDQMATLLQSFPSSWNSTEKQLLSSCASATSSVVPDLHTQRSLATVAIDSVRCAGKVLAQIQRASLKEMHVTLNVWQYLLWEPLSNHCFHVLFGCLTSDEAMQVVASPQSSLSTLAVMDTMLQASCTRASILQILAFTTNQQETSNAINTALVLKAAAGVDEGGAFFLFSECVRHGLQLCSNDTSECDSDSDVTDSVLQYHACRTIILFKSLMDMVYYAHSATCFSREVSAIAALEIATMDLLSSPKIRPILTAMNVAANSSHRQLFGLLECGLEDICAFIRHVSSHESEWRVRMHKVQEQCIVTDSCTGLNVLYEFQKNHMQDCHSSSIPVIPLLHQRTVQWIKIKGLELLGRSNQVELSREFKNNSLKTELRFLQYFVVDAECTSGGVLAKEWLDAATLLYTQAADQCTLPSYFILSLLCAVLEEETVLKRQGEEETSGSSPTVPRATEAVPIHVVERLLGWSKTADLAFTQGIISMFFHRSRHSPRSHLCGDKENQNDRNDDLGQGGGGGGAAGKRGRRSCLNPPLLSSWAHVRDRLLPIMPKQAVVALHNGIIDTLNSSLSSNQETPLHPWKWYRHLCELVDLLVVRFPSDAIQEPFQYLSTRLELLKSSFWENLRQCVCLGSPQSRSEVTATVAFALQCMFHIFDERKGGGEMFGGGSVQSIKTSTTETRLLCLGILGEPVLCLHVLVIIRHLLMEGTTPSTCKLVATAAGSSDFNFKEFLSRLQVAMHRSICDTHAAKKSSFFTSIITRCFTGADSADASTVIDTDLDVVTANGELTAVKALLQYGLLPVDAKIPATASSLLPIRFVSPTLKRAEKDERGQRGTYITKSSMNAIVPQLSRFGGVKEQVTEQEKGVGALDMQHSQEVLSKLGAAPCTLMGVHFEAGGDPYFTISIPQQHQGQSESTEPSLEKQVEWYRLLMGSIKPAQSGSSSSNCNSDEHYDVCDYVMSVQETNMEGMVPISPSSSSSTLSASSIPPCSDVSAAVTVPAGTGGLDRGTTASDHKPPPLIYSIIDWLERTAYKLSLQVHQQHCNWSAGNETSTFAHRPIIDRHRVDTFITVLHICSRAVLNYGRSTGVDYEKRVIARARGLCDSVMRFILGVYAEGASVSSAAEENVRVNGVEESDKRAKRNKTRAPVEGERTGGWWYFLTTLMGCLLASPLGRGYGLWLLPILQSIRKYSHVALDQQRKAISNVNQIYHRDELVAGLANSLASLLFVSPQWELCREQAEILLPTALAALPSKLPELAPAILRLLHAVWSGRAGAALHPATTAMPAAATTTRTTATATAWETEGFDFAVFVLVEGLRVPAPVTPMLRQLELATTATGVANNNTTTDNDDDVACSYRLQASHALHYCFLNRSRNSCAELLNPSLIDNFCPQLEQLCLYGIGANGNTPCAAVELAKDALPSPPQDESTTTTTTTTTAAAATVTVDAASDGGTISIDADDTCIDMACTLRLTACKMLDIREACIQQQQQQQQQQQSGSVGGEQRTGLGLGLGLGAAKEEGEEDAVHPLDHIDQESRERVQDKCAYEQVVGQAFANETLRRWSDSSIDAVAFYSTTTNTSSNSNSNAKSIEGEGTIHHVGIKLEQEQAGKEFQSNADSGSTSNSISISSSTDRSSKKQHALRRIKLFAMTQADPLGAVLLWLLILQKLDTRAAQDWSLRGRCVNYLKSNGVVTNLMNLLVHLSGDLLKFRDISALLQRLQTLCRAEESVDRTGTPARKKTSNWNAKNEKAGAGSILLGTLQHLSIYALFRTVCTLPAMFRSFWSDDCTRVQKLALSQFVEERVRTSLISREVALIAAARAAGRWNPDEFQVRGSATSGDITATLSRDETTIEIQIKIPSVYPLKNVEVTCTSRIGMSDGRWRRWVLQIIQLLSVQDGSMVDAVLMWKSNIEKELEGVEPCPICYCTLHSKTLCLPTLACPTCNNKFHSPCLYTWFRSSGKSKCVICQQPFFQ